MAYIDTEKIMQYAKAELLREHREVISVMLEELPTADAEAVVHCRDCKYCHKHNCKPRDVFMCSQRWNYTEEVDPDGFCYRGEAKEATDETSHS